MKRIPLILGLVVLFLLSCTRRELAPKEQIVARANGQPIYLSDFLVNYHQLRGEQDDISQKNPKLMDSLKTRALNEVIILGLVRQEAAKRDVRVAKEEVEGRLANWKDGYPPGGFEEMLKKQNTTEDFLRKRIEDQMIVEKLSDTIFANETMVSDEEVKRYYKLNETHFLRPERVHVFQIVVPSKEEAEKIRHELTAGRVSFESAARQYSLSPDAAKGGDLGFFARHEKIAAFDEAFSLSIGNISAPVQSRYGVHLLKVVEKQPTKRLSFLEAKEDIVRILRQSKQVASYKEWVTKLLKDGEIYRNETLYNQTT